MDLDLLFRINRLWEHPMLDRVLPGISAFGAWLPVFVLVAGLIAWRGGFKGRAMLVVLGLTIGLSDGLIARHLKRAADRPRPHKVVYDLTVREISRDGPEWVAVFREPRLKPSWPKERPEPGSGRSFPSAHVVNTVAATTVVVLFYGWPWAWLYVLPLGVAWSRIYTASHWPSDVAAAVPIGLAAALAATAVAEFGWRRFGPAGLPESLLDPVRERRRRLALRPRGRRAGSGGAAGDSVTDRGSDAARRP